MLSLHQINMLEVQLDSQFLGYEPNSMTGRRVATEVQIHGHDDEVKIN